MERLDGLEKSNNYQVFSGRTFENILNGKIYRIDKIFLKCIDPEKKIQDFEVICSFFSFPVGIEKCYLTEEIGCFFTKYSMR